MLNRFFTPLAVVVLVLLVAAAPHATTAPTALGTVVSRQGANVTLKVDAANVGDAKMLFNGSTLQVQQLVNPGAGTWGSIGTAKITNIQFSGADVIVTLQVIGETQPQGQAAYATGARVKITN